jgi:pimeloyl-ACP methyl ester carboxylesterase
LRPVSADNFARSDVDALDTNGWKSLAEGKSLLLIHGIFSTAHGAFGGMPADIMQQLCDRYSGRVWAFNHFTVSHDPAKNVAWFLNQIPANAKLDVDIICHSRGGLVSRCLAREGAKGSSINVDRIVLVGVPNAGTPLADPEHMMHMIDRFTTILNFFPANGVTEALESIITVIKIIAHGAIRALDGPAAMNPGGTFLKNLNAGTSKSNYYAIAADYTPTDENLKRFLTGTVNAVADRVFANDPNDLVVPTIGVFDKNGAAGFPVSASQVFRFPAAEGVMHTRYFSSPKTCQNLLKWLS